MHEKAPQTPKGAFWEVQRNKIMQKQKTSDSLKVPFRGFRGNV